MPRYLIERQFEVDEAAMPEVGKKSRVLVEERFPEITWELSHVCVGDDGLVKTFCVYGAPNEAMVREHAKQLGFHEILSLFEIAGDVTPADFPG
ncbi:MAG: nickel-binding protein [Candidatus Dormiibacterota bacterium]